VSGFSTPTFSSQQNDFLSALSAVSSVFWFCFWGLFCFVFLKKLGFHESLDFVLGFVFFLVFPPETISPLVSSLRGRTCAWTTSCRVMLRVCVCTCVRLSSVVVVVRSFSKQSSIQ